jgi:hypothetical protein
LRQLTFDGAGKSGCARQALGLRSVHSWRWRQEFDAWPLVSLIVAIGRDGLENNSDGAHVREMAYGKIDPRKAANIAVVVGTVLFCVVLLFFVGK